MLNLTVAPKPTIPQLVTDLNLSYTDQNGEMTDITLNRAVVSIEPGQDRVDITIGGNFPGFMITTGLVQFWNAGANYYCSHARPHAAGTCWIDDECGDSAGPWGAWRSVVGDLTNCFLYWDDQDATNDFGWIMDRLTCRFLIGATGW